MTEMLKEKVAQGFTACFDSSCPLHEHCMRWQGRVYVKSRPLVVTVVNQANPQVGGPQCLMYSHDEPVRMAYGFTALLNILPRGAGRHLLARIIDTYHRTYAYEYRNGTRPMPPLIQHQIEQWCRELGWEGPVDFDRYSEEYEW